MIWLYEYCGETEVAIVETEVAIVSIQQDYVILKSHNFRFDITS